MIFSSMGLVRSHQPSSTMLLLLVIALAARVSAADTKTTTTTSNNNYPVMTVPPTADAPYMQHSNLPQGTVFIAVGGALGLIALIVLAWRGLVAWSVNRSVRKAALAMQQPSETKGLLRPNNNRRRSTPRTHGPVMSVSLEKLPGSHRNSYNPRASKIPSSSSGLFFSPTAGAGGMHTSGNRASSYLPAGYYAAGSASPGSGAPNMPYSSSELRPQSQGYARPMSGPSPPGSPLATAVPNNPYGARQSFAAGSTSTVNLTAPPQGRTPSAFLEDLFENHAPQSDSNHR